MNMILWRLRKKEQVLIVASNAQAHTTRCYNEVSGSESETQLSVTLKKKNSRREEN
jgi:hypothetical protein